MTNKTQRTYGIIIMALGFIFLNLNAVDYLAGWNRISSGFTLIGLALAVIGAGMFKKAHEKFNQENS
jgi:dipeptide/tripeptide permease